MIFYCKRLTRISQPVFQVCAVHSYPISIVKHKGITNNRVPHIFGFSEIPEGLLNHIDVGRWIHNVVVYDKLQGICERHTRHVHLNDYFEIHSTRNNLLLRVPNPICMIICGFAVARMRKKQRLTLAASSDPYNLHAFNLIRQQKLQFHLPVTEHLLYWLSAACCFVKLLCKAPWDHQNLIWGLGLGHRYAVK